ncbi:MAG: DUF748 domain-containing protein [candidate division NC10 bacterium]|nr:DUF748 domain-containing protein [candidate division NC10 bacterium]
MRLLAPFTRRRLRIAGFSFGLLLVLFTLFGFFALPLLLKSVLTQQLSEALHRPASIQEIRVNPYALSVTVRGFKVSERDGPETFVGFEELYVNAELSSILRRGPVLKEIRLTRPVLRLVRHAEERYNFSDLLTRAKPTPAGPPARSTEPLRFSLNNIEIVEGSLDFIDEPVGKTHTVRGLHIGIPFLSNVPSDVDIFTEPRIEAKINDDVYAVRGKTKPFADSLESRFDVDISGLDIPQYLAYTPVPLKFRVPSGALDVKSAISFIRQKQSQTLTVTGDLILKDFALTDRRDNPILKLPVVEVGIAPSEPLARKIHVATLNIQGPEITLRRERDGLTNIQAVLPDAPKEARAKGEPTAAESTTPPTFLVDAIQLTGGRLRFADAVPARPFRTTLHPIELAVMQLGNAPDARASLKLSARTEAREDIQAEGELTLAPLAATIKTSVRGILLTKYAPYYQDLVRFTLQTGKAETAAALRYSVGKDAPAIRATDISVTVRDLALANEDGSGEFLRVPMLAVNDTEVDLTKRQVTVGSLSGQKGAMQITRDPQGEMVLFRLLASPAPGEKAAAAPPAEASAAAAPWGLVLRRAALDQFTLTLDDRFTSPPTILTLENLTLRAQDFSTAKGSTGKADLSFQLDQAAQVGLATAVSLEPLQADGRLEITRLPVQRYAPYYRRFIGFEIEDAVTDVATKFSYARPGPEAEVKLTGLGVSLENLRIRLRKEQEALLTVPALAVRNGSLDLAKREVTLGEVSSQKGALRVVRFGNGALNLHELMPPAPQEAAAPAGPPVQAAPAAPWVVAVGSVSLAEYRADITDRVPAEPVSIALDQIDLQAGELSTKPNTQGKVNLSLRINETGTLRLGGSVGISPLAAKLDLTLKNLEIRPVQPYFTDRVKIVVSEGSVSAAGRLELAERAGAGLGAAYKGEASINRFASIDKARAEDFLGWQSLALSEMDFGHNPFHFRARKVALADYFARLVLDGDGSLNVQDVLVKGDGASPIPAATMPGSAPAPPAAEQAAEAPVDIKIDEVTLQGGRVSFTDRSVNPSYASTMVELGGRISGLSSALNTLADLNLQGRLEHSAPLEITGKLNPLAKDLYADLKVRFRDIELSSATPYSGKYIGYSIQKGKLNLDLKYLIDKRKLDSQNVILLDQFTLGDAVESPQATKLPVKLAISLLKDRNGEINLDIPVSGSLDDPQFSIWKVVWQAIGNLIVKAVTSPFALLGAAFGGGEQMSYLEFDYGSAAINADGQKKLDALAKAMVNRPSLKLDMESFVDAEQDRESLRKIFFTRKLQAQKLLDQTKRGRPRVPLEEVKIESQEYEKYLKMAYDFAKFPKPRNFIGMTKSLPAVEMEKLILTHIQVMDDDLRALAAERAHAVKAALTRAQVAPERIFVLTPRALTPEKKDTQRDSRVEFTIG